MHAPSGKTTHTTQKKPHTLPRKNHACPPGATTHAPPPEQPHMPPWSNHAPPRSNHACPPPPRSNHACPPGATTHAPPVDRMTDTCKNITFADLRAVIKETDHAKHRIFTLKSVTKGSTVNIKMSRLLLPVSGSISISQHRLHFRLGWLATVDTSTHDEILQWETDPWRNREFYFT